MKLVKILLVDDLKDNLLALEGLLERDDLDIYKSKSGTEALDLLMSHEFAVALIDVQMPGMSGFELAELMRGITQTQGIPIIFVSATAKQPSYSFEGYESGAVDFLLKPLDPHSVKCKVNIFVELFRTQRDQREILKTLKETQAELEKAVRTRDEFMSIASHELKTPLTSLKLQAQLRKRILINAEPSAFSPERLAKMFDGDEKQLDRLARLVDDMLDISRISSGKLSINLERFDLCEVVESLIDRSRGQFEAAGCPVDIAINGSAFGSWDRLRIEQVVTNLLTNAIRYGSGKPISVQVNAIPAGAQVVVRDQGQGIAVENHERIFQRFERVRGTEVTGLGLGLYIVKQIIVAHQGSIRVESELGQGASFIFELPQLEGHEQVSPKPSLLPGSKQRAS